MSPAPGIGPDPAPATPAEAPWTQAPERRTAVVVALLGGAAFVLLAAFLVPWDPVSGPSPDPVAASDYFTAEQIARAESFSTWARVWSWSGLVIGLAVTAWLGFSRTARRWAARAPGPWWVQVVALTAALGLVERLVTLPTSLAYRQLALDAGLSTSTAAAWTRDLVVGELVDTAVLALVMLAIVGAARRWRRAWPAVAGAGLAVAVLVASYAYPVVIEPLFNDFTPMAEGQLRTDILELAEEEGVEVDDVLVADASRRTTALNAYVSGFGDTRRVVVYDTLVDDLPEDQALSVIAHELAHAAYDDVLVGTALGAAGALFAVGVGALVLGALRRRGFAPAAAPAVVPTLVALVALGSFLALPVQNGISRQIETRADVVALETTQDPEAFIAMQQQLAVRNLSDPTPLAWSQWWFGSHPTTVERLGLARHLED